MPRKAKELKDMAVKALKAPGLHWVGGVPGLALQIKPPGKSWILRFSFGGRRHDMGLGPYDEVSLADARRAAEKARALVRDGVNPVERRRAAMQAAATAAAVEPPLTFRKVAEKYMDAHESGWKNAKHRGQWTATLETYVYPTIGDLGVRDVELRHVLEILEPIWTKKTDTASKVRGRMELVLDYAAARGEREGLNPARWRGHLDKLLAKPTRIRTIRHHPALPADELGAFMRDLRNREGTGARALEFTILTAVRSGEGRGARWSEIDLKAKTWVIPKERMKGQRHVAREHRVPLSEEAVALLQKLPRVGDVDLVFPASRGGELSDATLAAVIKRMNGDGIPRWVDDKQRPVVPHGFRSTFRDWAAERTSYPRDVAEMALAHTVRDKTEAAYRRGDLFEKRRRMMADWAKFCAQPARGGEVLPIRGRA
jgi:integrase